MLVIHKDRGGDDEIETPTDPEEEILDEDWTWLKSALDNIFPTVTLGSR